VLLKCSPLKLEKASRLFIQDLSSEKKASRLFIQNLSSEKKASRLFIQDLSSEKKKLAVSLYRIFLLKKS
jgi:hypothetical protein